ncbi:AraC family ligand binding domain-containing protein [Xenophilus aerolatus]|nr:AraC family transcriptional regulator [Xenophilus aerolatus]
MARLDPLNTSRYRHAPQVPGMDLLHADFTTHEYAPHAHPSFVIAVTEVGGAAFRSRGRAGVAEPQALLVFNPSEPHSGHMGGSARWRYRAFYLAEPGIRHLMAALGLEQARHFDSNVLGDQALIDAFLALHRAFDADPGPDDPLARHERFVHTFGTLFQRHAVSGQRLPAAPTGAGLLAPVLELLHDAFAERLSLEQMAAAGGLTSFQLIGAFKRTTGLTPHAYLTQLRLRAAIRHLGAGQPLIDAAVASGFYDQSALTRHFKRTFGMTPLQYVRARAG